MSNPDQRSSPAVKTGYGEDVPITVLGHGVTAVPAIAMKRTGRWLSVCSVGHIFGNDQWSVVTRNDAELNQVTQRLIGEISKLEGPRLE